MLPISIKKNLPCLHKNTISETYYDEANLTDLTGDELEKKEKKKELKKM